MGDVLDSAEIAVWIQRRDKMDQVKRSGVIYVFDEEVVGEYSGFSGKLKRAWRVFMFGRC